MTPFTPATTAAFAQGSWNIYILQPEWLHRKGLLPDGHAVQVFTLTNGPGFRYSPHGRPVLWTMTPFEVTVETPAGAEPVWAALAQLIRALPETPLGGVGVRSVYRRLLADPVAADGVAGTVLLRGVSVLVQQDDARYFLELNQDVENRQELLSVTWMPPPADAGRAAEHLDAAIHHLEAGRRIAERHWQVTLS